MHFAAFTRLSSHGARRMHRSGRGGVLALAFLLAVCAWPALAGAAALSGPPMIAGIPAEFILFGLTLAGVALFHHHTLGVALTGLGAIVAYKFSFTGFKTGPGLSGLVVHMEHEWVVLANLFLLLMGFALLSRHFEKSKLPDLMPAILPDDWKGGFVLLAVVFVLSSFLDNIAGALIGGVMAREVFKGKVHIGYLAGIVAASNAGGAGSVVGDTTTTMMWISGVSPLKVVDAYVASVAALLVFGIPAALQQQKYSPVMKDIAPGIRVQWTRVVIVFTILLAAIMANVAANLRFPALLDQLPVIGLAVWAALLATAPLHRPDWEVMPETFKGTIFLLALVVCASLMPVEQLPSPAWQTALGIGFVSAVFDNIPLTALALRQGGYDWGFLAYAVGFGGSMIWFGSSAGVALANMYPEARSAGRWLRHGWHVVLAYFIGFMVMLALLGWHPDLPH
jgi:Na+/H+ antiporter NhaD/arsenite permease-like protein